MTPVLTPNPRRPDTSAIRLPNLRGRLTPPVGPTTRKPSWPGSLGGPPLRAA